MTKKEQYEAHTEKLLMPLLEEHQFELVDVEYVKEAGTWYLRVYLDKEGGINVNDCETISRAFGEILDREDYIEDSYIFEVSSPGLGRPIKKDKDYQRNLGEEVEVRLFRAVDHVKEYEGILEAFDKEHVTIRISEETCVELERKNIALIRLALDF